MSNWSSVRTCRDSEGSSGRNCWPNSAFKITCSSGIISRSGDTCVSSRSNITEKLFNSIRTPFHLVYAFGEEGEDRGACGKTSLDGLVKLHLPVTTIATSATSTTANYGSTCTAVVGCDCRSSTCGASPCHLADIPTALRLQTKKERKKGRKEESCVLQRNI